MSACPLYQHTTQLLHIRATSLVLNMVLKWQMTFSEVGEAFNWLIHSTSQLLILSFRA